MGLVSGGRNFDVLTLGRLDAGASGSCCRRGVSDDLPFVLTALGKVDESAWVVGVVDGEPDGFDGGGGLDVFPQASPDELVVGVDFGEELHEAVLGIDFEYLYGSLALVGGNSDGGAAAGPVLGVAPVVGLVVDPTGDLDCGD